MSKAEKRHTSVGMSASSLELGQDTPKEQTNVSGSAATRIQLSNQPWMAAWRKATHSSSPTSAPRINFVTRDTVFQNRVMASRAEVKKLPYNTDEATL